MEEVIELNVGRRYNLCAFIESCGGSFGLLGHVMGHSLKIW